jgi:hypothetical protein
MSATQQIVTRLREQRKGKVPVVVKGRERSIVFSRPTDLEMVEVNRAGGYFSDITSRFVVDWEGFIEDDLVGGGGTDKVAFDREIWKEWIADQLTLWQPIADAIIEAYRLHKESETRAQGE